MRHNRIRKVILARICFIQIVKLAAQSNFLFATESFAAPSNLTGADIYYSSAMNFKKWW
jgi:hypothetical protein